MNYVDLALCSPAIFIVGVIFFFLIRGAIREHREIRDFKWPEPTLGRRRGVVRLNGGYHTAFGSSVGERFPVVCEIEEVKTVGGRTKVVYLEMADIPTDERPQWVRIVPEWVDTIAVDWED